MSTRPVHDEAGADEPLMPLDLRHFARTDSHADQEHAPTPPLTSTPPAPGRSAERRSADDFSSERMLRPQAEAPRKGLRRLVFQLTGGLVNLRPSAAELRERDLIARVKAPVAGCRRIAVVSRNDLHRARRFWAKKLGLEPAIPGGLSPTAMRRAVPVFRRVARNQSLRDRAP
jgi:hypothetical protein